MGRRDDLRAKRAELTKRLRDGNTAEAEARKRSNDLEDEARRKGNKLDRAETDARREQLADDIDGIRGQRRLIHDRLEELNAREGQISAKLKRLGKRIRAAAKRLRRKHHYASEHFAYSEFDCNNGTPVPDAAKPALRHLCQTYLEPLRARYGSVHINSGFRTSAYNDSIGGAPDSIHIYTNHPSAVAADHTTGAPPSTVYDFENALGPGGLGRYSSFVHLDNRQRIGYATARWSG